VAENIYQIYARRQVAGFFVTRNCWTHPRTIARIVSINGRTTGEVQRAARGPAAGVVVADVCFRGLQIAREELSSPGTHTYIEIPKPDWWPD
jgi:hypothetical protein